ncbi:hypothetical protein GCM10011588_26120 [Nocardia jinanensis]|uniref:Uncharacterized protein n=1 Tax=Nocardia jinanensis TaxID=382504 RepID=A0A917RK72_9NOCA|nr:hypothetical protein GCM10011588_26120 [Nocardia jinanensis]
MKLADLERVGPPPCVRNVVELTDESGRPRAVAYVERELPPGGIPAYLAARDTGARSFVLWADEHRGSRAATVVTRSAGNGVATYQVLGAQGEVIGTLVREKAFKGRGIRTRWTVSRPGAGEAVGYKGRIFWWLVCWSVFPLMPFMFLAALFENSGLPRAPRRIRWRTGGRLLLDFRPFGDRLQLCVPESDWRLEAALIALLRSFDGWFSVSWDSHKK